MYDGFFPIDTSIDTVYIYTTYIYLLRKLMRNGSAMEAVSFFMMGRAGCGGVHAKHIQSKNFGVDFLGNLNAVSVQLTKVVSVPHCKVRSVLTMA